MVAGSHSGKRVLTLGRADAVQLQRQLQVVEQVADGARVPSGGAAAAATAGGRRRRDGAPSPSPAMTDSGASNTRREDSQQRPQRRQAPPGRSRGAPTHERRTHNARIAADCTNSTCCTSPTVSPTLVIPPYPLQRVPSETTVARPLPHDQKNAS
ncbi:uncharacterized protein LOC126413137 [Schistocerca serialis cubense]|uniref:uncharacterized protein LOC126413137 n=1 Tax=Schistocerca serialis cubense TaxID=2023355 RepID=UPI00214E02C0|nr:uncharacterized protein LOC126413137 [Schistocerca serialis cubense]